jgi:hypothetical protein
MKPRATVDAARELELMRSRLVTWIVLNIVFALLPLIIQMILRAADNLPIITSENVPDLTFLSVMLCVVAAGDAIKSKDALGTWVETTWVCFICAATFDVALLAIYESQLIPGPPHLTMIHFYLNTAYCVATLTIIGTLGIEIRLMKDYPDGSKGQ